MKAVDMLNKPGYDFNKAGYCAFAGGLLSSRRFTQDTVSACAVSSLLFY